MLVKKIINGDQDIKFGTLKKIFENGRTPEVLVGTQF
jgi:hypothetical protein